jgi:hypothetical protein
MKDHKYHFLAASGDLTPFVEHALMRATPRLFSARPERNL